MGVRNLEELGENSQEIIKRLLKNQNLLKLLYYNDKGGQMKWQKISRSL